MRESVRADVSSYSGEAVISSNVLNALLRERLQLLVVQFHQNTPGRSTSPAAGKLYGELWEVGRFRSLHLLKMCQQGVFLKTWAFCSNRIGIHLG